MQWLSSLFIGAFPPKQHISFQLTLFINLLLFEIIRFGLNLFIQFKWPVKQVNNYKNLNNSNRTGIPWLCFIDVTLRIIDIHKAPQISPLQAEGTRDHGTSNARHPGLQCWEVKVQRVVCSKWPYTWRREYLVMTTGWKKKKKKKGESGTGLML